LIADSASSLFIGRIDGGSRIANEQDGAERIVAAADGADLLAALVDGGPATYAWLLFGDDELSSDTQLGGASLSGADSSSTLVGVID
jgi:hypothetical protein